jgi:acyl carrier protein
MDKRIFELAELAFSVPSGTVDIGTQMIITRGWTSLNHMKFLLALEEEFDVRFSEENIVSIVEMSEVVDLVKEMLEGRKHGK